MNAVNQHVRILLSPAEMATDYEQYAGQTAIVVKVYPDSDVLVQTKDGTILIFHPNEVEEVAR